MKTDLLSGRTVSTYPLSIGTSLAMESIAKGQLPAYDEGFKTPNAVNLNQYDEIWINLATLHRNIIGAVGAQHIEELSAESIAQVLGEETQAIEDIVRTNAQGKPLVFYSCGYAGMAKRYPWSTLRSDTTPRQQHASALLSKTLSTYYKARRDRMQTVDDEHIEVVEGAVQPTVQLKHFTHELVPAQTSKVLLFSHYAVDLLKAKKCHLAHLLESHTGVLKPPALWYTKLQEAKTQPRIPFNSLTLQVFGDSQTFCPQKKDVRAPLLALAEQYKWNANTTTARIKLNLDMMPDKYTADILKKML
jgi:hypothetical protein